MNELQYLQNAANDLDLVIRQKHYYEDKRKTIPKFFAQKGRETVSPILDYEQMNHFLLGWREAIKSEKKESNLHPLIEQALKPFVP